MTLPAEELEALLHLADQVVTWTDQGTLRPVSAGRRHLISARQKYLKARIDAYAPVRPLTPRDSGGCTCGGCREIRDDCMYHYAAGLQPDNHRFPWNCPSYYDGCNCDERHR